MALLVLLERLTPTERAANVLREAFGYAYADIARIIQLARAASRQLVGRARKHIAQGNGPPSCRANAGLSRTRSSRPPGPATWRDRSSRSPRTSSAGQTAAASRAGQADGSNGRPDGFIRSSHHVKSPSSILMVAPPKSADMSLSRSAVLGQPSQPTTGG